MLACIFFFYTFCKVKYENTPPTPSPHTFLLGLRQVTASPLARLSWRGLAPQVGQEQHPWLVWMGAAPRGWHNPP